MRTKLVDRILPGYTRGEEVFHMASHATGCVMGVAMLLICVIVAAYNQNVWGIVCGCIYGCSMILLFTMSSIYHGLKPGMPKKVFQVLDHCSIFIMIAGAYTPVLLGAFRVMYPASAWSIFGVVWGVALLGIVLNAIDIQKFSKVSVVCYLAMGWCIVSRLRLLLDAYSVGLFIFLLGGGIVYTVGVVLYALGGKKKYMHSLFHIFINVAAVVQFIGIAYYVMPGIS